MGDPGGKLREGKPETSAEPRADPPQVRLRGGAGPCSGQVQVLLNRTWLQVCGLTWGPPEAQVLCRQLGCGPALGAPAGPHLQEQGPRPARGRLYLSGLTCDGSEAHLAECLQEGAGPGTCAGGGGGRAQVRDAQRCCPLLLVPGGAAGAADVTGRGPALAHLAGQVCPSSPGRLEGPRRHLPAQEELTWPGGGAAADGRRPLSSPGGTHLGLTWWGSPGTWNLSPEPLTWDLHLNLTWPSSPGCSHLESLTLNPTWNFSPEPHLAAPTWNPHLESLT
ncbi:putative DMBT1-like protein [Ammospiza nelsoni]|uniref:putative DMBT1-like protein n=1 Tax=Ammospiza nelsoni TaxID=2857394 RepID=UPI00286A4AFD|nr:putative DMBT1-like protein [Ammospiza nelsoni]